jgi:hypothetical protein
VTPRRRKRSRSSPDNSDVAVSSPRTPSGSNLISSAALVVKEAAQDWEPPCIQKLSRSISTGDMMTEELAPTDAIALQDSRAWLDKLTLISQNWRSLNGAPTAETSICLSRLSSLALGSRLSSIVLEEGEEEKHPEVVDFVMDSERFLSEVLPKLTGSPRESKIYPLESALKKRKVAE